VISAATHEAPYVLDGLLHHGTGLAIDTHYTDTGGATDHVFALCRMLGYRFCPRLRDFPDRRLAAFEPTSHYPSLKPLTLARYRAIDIMRSNAARHALAHDESSIPELVAPESKLDLGDRQALMRCLKTLPEEQCRCIVLAYCDGYSRE